MKNDLLLFQSIAEQLLQSELQEGVTPVIPTEKIHDSIDFSLNNEGVTQNNFEEIISQVVLNTPRTSSNKFFNQLFGGRKSKAVLGDLLAVLLNNSMYTYKVGGVQVGIEKEIINKVNALINYPKTANGTFATGGSMSNLMAMIMARDAKNSSIKSNGNAQNLIAYTSKESHYSNSKNAAFCGVGKNNVRYIAVDEFGKMLVSDLASKIAEDLAKGNTPFYVNATAGTTVMGAFDPVVEINEICKKHTIWLHIDGAYCGGVLFSDQHKHLIEGVNQGDSFSFNAHKMLNTPLTCSLILVKDKKHLYDSFSTDADYLYQTDGDDYNLGKTSLQCGRRNDALKFWSLWKYEGTNGLAKIIEKQFELADTARKYVSKHPDYKLYSFEESLSICFNYKGIPADVLCTQLYEQSELMVGFGVFNDIQFIRLVTINSENSNQDILNFFKILEQYVFENEEKLVALQVN